MGDIFKTGAKFDVGNPIAMSYGWGGFQGQGHTPFDKLSAGSKKTMTEKQKADYLAREDAKSSSNVQSPLSSRYS